MRKSQIVLFLCLFQLVLAGQNLEQVAETDSIKSLLRDPFTIHGNLGVNFRSYKAWQIDNRQYPLSSTINANATIQTKTFTFPFSLIIQNLNEVEHPFTQEYWEGFYSNQRNRLARFGVSPYYKWAKFHLGYRYMNFSEFTLANHNFLGGGMELTPKNWRFSAMAGRLAKAEPQDLSLRTPNIQKYTRTGYGFKVGYGTANDFIEASLFSAKDDPHSLDPFADSVFIVTPNENLVIGLKGKKSIGDRLTFYLDLAKSAFTRNARDPVYDQGLFLYNGFLFERKTSTLFATAVNTKLEYAKSDFKLGLQYRRIDPGYRSLGAYFFNDDLENVTLFSNFSLFKKLLSFQLEGGVQKNNLDGSKEASFSRIIGLANIAYRLKEWNFVAGLTNFSSKVEYQLNPDLDSLNAVIVSQEANIAINRSFSGGESVQNLNIIAGIQSVNDQIENPELSSNSDLFYANLSYSISTSSQWLYSLSLDLNSNSLSNTNLNRYGIGLQAAKGLNNNKIQLGAGMNYYLQVSSGDEQNNFWNNFLHCTWQAFKQQSFNLQLNWLWNSRTAMGTDNQFSELVTTIGYNLLFGPDPSKTRKANN